MEETRDLILPAPSAFSAMPPAGDCVPAHVGDGLAQQPLLPHGWAWPTHRIEDNLAQAWCPGPEAWGWLQYQAGGGSPEIAAPGFCFSQPQFPNFTFLVAPSLQLEPDLSANNSNAQWSPWAPPPPPPFPAPKGVPLPSPRFAVPLHDVESCGGLAEPMNSSVVPQGANSPPPQPQTLASFLNGSGAFEVHWVVDSRKLQTNDKQAVSPPFTLAIGSSTSRDVIFKMMLFPKTVEDGKGGACFKKSRGKGTVRLKCEGDGAEVATLVSFCISVGSSADCLNRFRGPVSHNFARAPVCGLPKNQEEFDFTSVTDAESLTFVVCLEVRAGPVVGPAGG